MVCRMFINYSAKEYIRLGEEVGWNINRCNCFLFLTAHEFGNQMDLGLKQLVIVDSLNLYVRHVDQHWTPYGKSDAGPPLGVPNLPSLFPTAQCHHLRNCCLSDGRRGADKMGSWTNNGLIIPWNLTGILSYLVMNNMLGRKHILNMYFMFPRSSHCSHYRQL